VPVEEPFTASEADISSATNWSLLDHLVGEDRDRIGDRQPDRLRVETESFINTTLSNLEDNSDSRRRMRKVDLRRLLHQVETAPSGSPELDSDFVREQVLNPHNFVGDR
jgi:hypothetical protein